MTFNETLNQFLLLGAALCKHVPSNDLEASQQTVVRDEVLYNVEFATSMKNLFKANMVFESENQGTIPTIKGWKSLQPRVVEVSKPFNRTRIPQNEIVPFTVSLMEEMCYRKRNHPAFKAIWDTQKVKLDDAMCCVFEEELQAQMDAHNNSVSLVNSTEEVVLETPNEEEVKVVTKSKKAKQVVEV